MRYASARLRRELTTYLLHLRKETTKRVRQRGEEREEKRECYVSVIHV